MNYETSTETQATVSGATSLKKYSECWNTSMSKEQAHKLLNEVKAGIPHTVPNITRALLTTGDWV